MVKVGFPGCRLEKAFPTRDRDVSDAARPSDRARSDGFLRTQLSDAARARDRARSDGVV